MEEEGEGMRARSFRNEDYNNRRVFLRSYPLRWGDDADDGQEERGGEGQMPGGGGDGGGGDHHKGWVAPLKRRMAGAVFRWRGDTAVLVRKIKSRVAFYLVACRPFGFKPPHHHHPPSPGC